MTNWRRTIGSSLFTQVLAVSLSGLVGFLLFILILFQTTTIFRVFPSALQGIAKPLSEIVFLIENVPPDAEETALSALAGQSYAARLSDAFPPDAKPRPGLRDQILAYDLEVAAAFARRDLRFRHLSPAALVGQNRAGETSAFRAMAALEISVTLKDGRVLSVLFSPTSLLVGQSRGFVILLVLAVFFFGGVSAVLLNQALRPLRELEQATHRFGETDAAATPLRETGAEEIRRVARALNRSQRRVESLMEERARIVSAIAHDVRTSITRLRLRIDQPSDFDSAAATRDLDQMQTLIEDMLTYARSSQKSPQLELMELTEFIQAYAEDSPAPLEAEEIGHQEVFSVAGDPVSLRRALNNLVDNAVRYGGGAALKYGRTDHGFEIRIEDDGPGIDNSLLETVFEPFYRLEDSRNRATGGSGLGLGIARTLIEAQGGALMLENRKSGGLRAIIQFPESCRVV